MKRVPCARLRTSSRPKIRENPEANKNVRDPTERPRSNVITKSLDSIPWAAIVKRNARTARRIRIVRFFLILCGKFIPYLFAPNMDLLCCTQIFLNGFRVINKIFHLSRPLAEIRRIDAEQGDHVSPTRPAPLPADNCGGFCQ